MIQERLDCFVFDLDSTLCYPNLEYADLFIEVFGEPFEAHKERWSAHIMLDGPCSGREAVAACFPHYAPKDIDATFQRMVDGWAKAQRLFDGVEELVGALRNTHEGCKLGILTNGPSAFQWAVMNELDLPALFDFCHASGDTDFGIRKPSQEALELIERRYGVAR